MKLKLREIALFGMFGALIFASKIVMEILPNVHLIGVFVVALTVVYRKKALYPLYIFVFILGLYNGFPMWWIPHLYLWTVLWGVVMLLPKNMPIETAPFVYMTVCAIHGFLFGILYAPAESIMFGLDFKQTCMWIVAGLPWDFVHGVSNFICGIMIVPLVMAIRRSDKYLS